MEQPELLHIKYIHPRCCGATQNLRVSTRSLMEGIENGEVEVLGWDEQEDVLHVHGGICKACMEDLREVAEELYVLVRERAMVMEGWGEGGD